MTAGHILRDRPAVCLDITRSVSRVGRGPATGIDRVELAYIEHFSQTNAPVFGLLRTALGYLLLDKAGLRAAADRLHGREVWGPSDILGSITRRHEPSRAGAEADLRKRAIGRAPRGSLQRLLSRSLPRGFTYLNVGHSHLSEKSLAAIRKGGADHVACLVHDFIPLVRPDLQGPGSVQRFRERMKSVAQHADTVITSAQATKRSIEEAFSAFGCTPKIEVLPLGVDLPEPQDPHANPKAPYFVTVGTLDPRKGIVLLLDVWEDLANRLGSDVPKLVLIGQRGWGPEALHRRLSAAVSTGTVVELNTCSDADRIRYVAGASAALQPSELEGFGLPVFEAGALGTPVVASDLPVYREFLGDLPVYVTPGDLYHWKKAIEQHIEQCREGPIPRKPRFNPPTWAEHFSVLDQIIAEHRVRPDEAVPSV